VQEVISHCTVCRNEGEDTCDSGAKRKENCHDARILELTNDFRFRNNVRARRFPLTLYKHGLRPHVNEVCAAERLFSRF
jgi:hypothetical protein